MSKNENLLVKVLIALAGLTIGVVVVLTIIAFQIGVDELEKPNKIAIISGLLSMFGGIAGAFGAYAVATYQLNKQIEHEKKKEELLYLEQTKKTLKKLEFLNDYAINFIAEFVKDFNKQYNEEIDFKLKSSETSMLWIVKKINSVNDGLLNEILMLDFLALNHLMNHTYNEIIVFNNLPIEQKSHNLPGLIQIMHELEKDFIDFEQYVKEQLEELENRKVIKY
ncbi:hypothetical protein C7Y47_24035 [Lysinibacillus sphaericus]|uniref:Uncharacterized protein n=1 Tax=Lysinibacillus sphaericus TaxID=1421 RepID=A0A544U7D4_LYSSH|nr:hypothetical protein [Lysinibacillus sp. SDF0037]TQR26859.1 hypothetical protein C7Y47_24035 [Lysinibacillus sp. SDF0037]